VKDQFQVWSYEFPGKIGVHPAVVISPPDQAARSRLLNVLFCTSQRQSRKPYPYEVMLDTEDGLSWETFCDCSLVWMAPSDRLFDYRGLVTMHRRNAIRDMVRDWFWLTKRD
jgi:mRNA-degrading endonuclease toxin of MazEF toxin-antitoxin module